MHVLTKGHCRRNVTHGRVTREYKRRHVREPIPLNHIPVTENVLIIEARFAALREGIAGFTLETMGGHLAVVRSWTQRFDVAVAGAPYKGLRVSKGKIRPDAGTSG